MNIPDNKLSYSRIKMVTTCPRKFQYSYIDKIKGITTIPLLLGSNWHRGIEHGVKLMIERMTPKTKEVVEVAVEQLKMDFKKQNNFEFTDFDPDKRTARDDLARMAGMGFDEVKKYSPVRSEEIFKIPLDDDGTMVKGIPDIEEQDEIGDGITELKTTTREPQSHAIFDLQQSIYQWARPETSWLKKLITIRHKNKNRDITIKEFWRPGDTKEKIQETKNYLLHIKRLILGYMEFGFPKTNDLDKCGWCHFRFGCRPEIFNDPKYGQGKILNSTMTKKGDDDNAIEINKREGSTNSRSKTNRRKQSGNGSAGGDSIFDSKSQRLPFGF